MPTIDHRLASQRLQVQGGHRGLNPVLFDTSAAARVRAPQIDPNAANVQFTPVQPGQVGIKTPLEATAEGASKLMEVWGNAATQYADRQHELDASIAISQIKQSHQAYLYGSVDQNGERIPGFLDTRLDETRKGYAGLLKQLDQSNVQILQQLSPGARTKAALQAQSMREDTLQVALKHRQTEEVELEKRAYNQRSEIESDEIAAVIDQSAGAMYGAIEAKDANTQATLGAQIKMRIEAAVERRYAGLHNAPANADPANDAVVDIYKSILARPNGIVKALAYKPVLDQYVTSTEARTAIGTAFNTAREHSLKALEYNARVQEALDKDYAVRIDDQINSAAAQAAKTNRAPAEFMPPGALQSPTVVEKLNKRTDELRGSIYDRMKVEDLTTYAMLHGLTARQAQDEYKPDDKMVALEPADISKIDGMMRAGMDKNYQHYGNRVETDISSWLKIMAKDGVSTIPMESEIGQSAMQLMKNEMLGLMQTKLQDPKTTRADLDTLYNTSLNALLSGQIIDIPFVFEPASAKLPKHSHIFNNAGLAELANLNEQDPSKYYEKLKVYATPEYVKSPEVLEQIKLIMADTNTDEETLNYKANAVAQLFFEAQRSSLAKNGVDGAMMNRWDGDTYRTLMTRFFNDLFTGQRKSFKEQIQQKTDTLKQKMGAK